MITFIGRQENLASREAAFFALVSNLVMLVAAIVSIVITVPKGKSGERGERGFRPVAGRGGPPSRRS